MKLLLLRLKLFFSSSNTKQFVKVFVVSFPIILALMWFLFTQREQESRSFANKEIREEFLEIANMPQITNRETIIEPSFVDKENENPSNRHFWKGDAINYRYLESQQGKPKP